VGNGPPRWYPSGVDRPGSRRPFLLWLGLVLLLAAACAGRSAGQRTGAFPPGAAPSLGESPSDVLSTFVEAVEGGLWGEAVALLSARWRARYTPERLEADYLGAGPLARETAARALEALRAGAPLRLEEGRAELPVPGGRALLVAEAGGWRVDALE